MSKIEIAEKFITWVVLNVENELPQTVKDKAVEAAFLINHHDDTDAPATDANKHEAMTVGELVAKLSEVPNDTKVVAYTKCGPDAIGGISYNGNGEVCLLGKSDVCAHIMDGGCKKI